MRLIYGPMRRLLRLGVLGGLVCASLVLTSSPGSITIRPLRYIALGDSFSSGEGLPPFRQGTDKLLPPRNTCHRSYRAYPSLIAGRRSSPGIWGFWACSGAQVADMSQANHEDPGEIAQLDRIAPPDRSDRGVDLVTLSIGGNDAQFASTWMRCVVTHVVPALGSCQADWRVRVQDEIQRLRTSLPSLFRALRARAPRARIIVLGYPNPFPASVPILSRCRLWFEPVDLRWLSGAAAALNGAIQASTIRAKANVTYLAPSGFAGHDVCSAAPWFNGLNVVPTHFRYSFHPNVLGQRRLAKNVLAVL
jgi:lysophospholipase L1-like esterase